jgi:anti-sigma regulatory factor (Ser/Thr protein kinase)
MDLDSRPWTLTLPSELRLLPLARVFVEAACQAARLEPAVADAVVLAAHEAASNVIRHAHRCDPARYFQMHCYLRPDGVEIHLLDEGDPFDIDAVPQLNPAELRIGGRGLFLMRALMDELSCRPRGERGNTLRMVKRRSPPCRDAG